MIWYLIYIVAALIVISKLTSGWCYSKICLVGKTAIITGSNSGLGYQVALNLASRGCRVIIADRADGTKSRAQIVKETNNTNVLYKHLDLSSFKSIRKFAQDIIDTEEYVHILINNAGVGTFTMQYTEDGLQRTMQINYFGHFLLTCLLLGLLKKSAPSRILFTSSIAAYMTKMNPSHLNPPSDFKLTYALYPNSKLCVAVAANVLSEKLKGTGVTVNSCHPGGVRSGLFLKAFKEEGTIIVLLAGLFALLFGKNTEEGAQTLIYMAIDRQVENYTGQYFMDCCRVIQPFQIYNKQFCEEIWNKTLDYVKLQPQEIKML